ncbi:MAG: hypothetical protein R3E53_03850 [Myxococcota bacterium]
MRSDDDRRSVAILVTEEGQRVLEAAPSLLQERFRTELARLETWSATGCSLGVAAHRVHDGCRGLDAAPILETGSVAASGEDDES